MIIACIDIVTERIISIVEDFEGNPVKYDKDEAENQVDNFRQTSPFSPKFFQWMIVE